MGLVSGLALLLTIVMPEWIEFVFHVDLDASNGSLEWMIALALAAVTIGSLVAARVEWRLRQPATA
jgi:hypothetical protein